MFIFQCLKLVFTFSCLCFVYDGNFFKFHIYLVSLTTLMDNKLFYITQNYFAFSSLFRRWCRVSKLVLDLLEEEGWGKGKEQYGFYLLLHISKSTVQSRNCQVSVMMEEHQEVSKSCTNKYYEDAVIAMQYILPWGPFCLMKELINIHTGEVADRRC